MFTVRITFLNEVDEYGHPCREYNFDDVHEARRFYEQKKEDYKDDNYISVSTDA